MRRWRFSLTAWLFFALAAGVVPLRVGAQSARGAGPHPVGASDTDEGPSPTDRTPPRLSYADGQVSFWREGAEDWTQARVNTPLAPGDQLYVGNGSNLELEIGSRDFLRVASNSQLAFDNDEADYRQFRLTSGQASMDLHGMRAGQVVEVDTPNGAFTVDHNGYYRIEVGDDATHFSTRRGGRATVTPANGDPEDVSPSEEVVVKGNDVESYAASEPDAWDRWNYDRSDQLVEAVSYRHVPEDVYGGDDLDHNGHWRVVPQYGSVWFPSGVATGWAPYSAGRWIMDPYYGWTWVDDAPWGWAPFHYGRWVFTGGFWGWAPGPVVAASYYSPALVAFFGVGVGPLSIGVSVGTPFLGWTALGWGEPCWPWWGPSNFVGHPHWFGWGGPRVTINQNVVNNINVFQNARVNNGVVVVNRNQFGHGGVAGERVASPNLSHAAPIRGAVPVSSDPTRIVGGAARGARPPESMGNRSVVATRAPAAERASRGFFGGSRREAGAPANPTAQIVPSPHEARARGTLQRPRFGEQAGVERAAPPPPPRFGDVHGGRVGASSTASRSPADTSGMNGGRRGAPQQPERSTARAERSTAPPPPTAAAEPSQRRTAPSTTQHGVGRNAPTREAAREPMHATPHEAPQAPRSAPRSGAPQMDSGRHGRQQEVRQPAASPPHVARELPGQPANRVWAGRSNPGPAPSMSQQQRRAESPRQMMPQSIQQQRGASGGGHQSQRRLAAEQQGGGPNAGAPSGTQLDTGSHGHGNH